MAVRLILCRHTKTGTETELPETALRYGHMPTYEPVDDDDRARIRALQDADKAAAAAEAETDDTGQPVATPDSTPSNPSAAADTRTTTAKSKPATGAAKKQTKE